MRRRESCHIDRPAVKVWPSVICPEYFRQWNSKVSAMALGERDA